MAELCDRGCGKPAVHRTRNGMRTCSRIAARCGFKPYSSIRNRKGWLALADEERSNIRQPGDGRGTGAPNKPQMIIRCGNPKCSKERIVPITFLAVRKKSVKYCQECRGIPISLGGIKANKDPKVREAHRQGMLRHYSTIESRYAKSAQAIKAYNDRTPFNLLKISKYKKWACNNLDGTHFQIENFIAALEAQDWKCAFPGCGKSQKDEPKTFHVDHDHVTGKFRALVCPSCNRNVIVGHTLESANNLVQYLSST